MMDTTMTMKQAAFNFLTFRAEYKGRKCDVECCMLAGRAHIDVKDLNGYDIVSGFVPNDKTIGDLLSQPEFKPIATAAVVA